MCVCVWVPRVKPVERVSERALRNDRGRGTKG